MLYAWRVDNTETDVVKSGDGEATNSVMAAIRQQLMNVDLIWWSHRTRPPDDDGHWSVAVRTKWTFSYSDVDTFQEP